MDRFSHSLGSCFDTALKQHRVSPSSQVLQTFRHHRVRQHSRCGGTIASDIIRFGGSFFQQLGTHILKWVFQFNFFCYGYAIMGNRWGTILAIDSNIAPFGAESRYYGVGNDINTVFQ